MGRKWDRRRDDSGSMLATIIVVVVGAGLCCFLVVLGDPGDSETLLQIIGCSAFLVLLQVFRYRYGRNNGSSLAFWSTAARHCRDDGLHDYEPRIKGDGRPPNQTGSNEPITAQEAHELQVNSSSTWVPSRARGRKRKS